MLIVTTPIDPVRGLAPTNEVACDLKKLGFTHTSTLHSLLYLIEKGKGQNFFKEIWIIDESSMVENNVLQEVLRIAWKKNHQVILVGDEKQLPPVGRGGIFKILCEKFNTAFLDQILRQEEEWGRDVTKNLSQGETSKAIMQLYNNRALIWSDTKLESIMALIKRWMFDQEKFPNQKFFILEHLILYNI